MNNNDKINLKYNYIVISAGFVCYKYVFQQLNEMDNAVYIDEICFSPMVDILYRIHFSNRINSIVKLPFKRIWIFIFLKNLKKYVNKLKSKTNNESVCFVFLSGGRILNLLEYNLKDNIKKFFPCSSIVFYSTDLIEKLKKPIEKMKEQSDMCISFDKGDAQKYSLFYYNIPYSDIATKYNEHSSPEFDICFVGAAKDRMEDIYKAYEFLVQNGLKCDFHLIGVPTEERKYAHRIQYYDGLISYEDNLRILSNSRCILEIMQKGGMGNTLRVDEAIIFDKKLLSNNIYLPENVWYEKKYMKVFEKLDNSDLEFLKDNGEVIYEHKEGLYPDKFLKFIDSKL